MIFFADSETRNFMDEEECEKLGHKYRKLKNGKIWCSRCNKIKEKEKGEK